jgi:hypothetical protein
MVRSVSLGLNLIWRMGYRVGLLLKLCGCPQTERMFCAIWRMLNWMAVVVLQKWGNYSAGARLHDCVTHSAC